MWDILVHACSASRAFASADVAYILPSFFCSTVAWVLFFSTSAPLIQSRALLFAICTMIVSDLDFVELSSDTNAHIVCHPGPFLGFLGFGDPLLAPCPWAPGKE